MPLACSKETLVWLFLYATSAFKLLFFFSFLFSYFAFNLFSSFFRRNREYEYDALYEEEDEMPEVVAATEEEEEEGFGYYGNFQIDQDEHLLEDDLEFLPQRFALRSKSSSDDLTQFKDSNEVGYLNEEEAGEEHVIVEQVEEEVIVEDITGREDSYLDEDFEPNPDTYNNKCSYPISISDVGKKQDLSPTNTQISSLGEQKKQTEHKEEPKLKREDEFLINQTHQRETNKLQLVDDITLQDRRRRLLVLDDHEDETYADSCTVGSTSKDSSDWRSSITFRDSATDDPFSSSSRRSCPKWESYTVFQKYDEEMTFLDTITFQKLQETETLKSLHLQPRSISQRIVHQFATTTISKTKIPTSSEGLYQRSKNPYYELEAAYVAQVCLAWEALSWDYNNFRHKQALLRQHGNKSDLGCPAHVAQQFQQFQVLLQRYVETEPYEYGKRPEVYARMRRTVAPKLLLVPEYQDCEDDEKEQQAASSRITSASFLEIIEDSIRTFMNFLRADRESPYHALLKSLFKKRKRGSVDPALVKVLKKANTKKKLKVKELQRGGNKCMRKKKLTRQEEMEILMCLIDLKVVSRVLRMWDLNHEQLRWCEEKMTKLTLSKQGKLNRDSTPLFFPAH